MLVNSSNLLKWTNITYNCLEKLLERTSFLVVLVGLTNAWRWLCRLLTVIMDASREAC